MSFTDQSFPVSAKLTLMARDVIALGGLEEDPLAFKIIGFSVGTGGYEPSNPVQTKPLNVSQTALENQVSPPTGSKPFQSIEKLGSVRVFNCRLPATPATSDADYGLGEIALWAEIIQSNDPNYPIGMKYMYAIGHMPIRAKTHKDVFLFRVVVNY